MSGLDSLDSACAFVPAYEQLRAGVLDTTTSSGHVGLCILLREGIAAWMEHSQPLSLSAQRKPIAGQRTTTRNMAPRLAVGDVGAGIVNVLVSMLTASRAQTRACS